MSINTAVALVLALLSTTITVGAFLLPRPKGRAATGTPRPRAIDQIGRQHLPERTAEQEPH